MNLPAIPIDPPHEHTWRDAPDVVREKVVQHSPVSHNDCYLYTSVVLVQTCACGEFRRVGLGRENERTGHR